MRNDEAVIGEWIKGGEAFVFYREPGERVCHGIRAARSSLQSFEVFPSNDGKTGFVFAPFRFGEGHPLWLLPLEEEIEVGISRAVCSDEVEAPAPMPFCGRLEEQPSKEYREAFRAFSGALRAGDFRSWCFRVVVRMLFPMAFHGHGLSRRPVAVMYIPMCICSIRRKPVFGWGLRPKFFWPEAKGSIVRWLWPVRNSCKRGN